MPVKINATLSDHIIMLCELHWLQWAWVKCGLADRHTGKLRTKSCGQ